MATEYEIGFGADKGDTKCWGKCVDPENWIREALAEPSVVSVRSIYDDGSFNEWRVKDVQDQA